MKMLYIAAAILLLAAATVPAFAHTGPLVGGEPPETQVELAAIETSTNLHDETINNPTEAYKGWWWVNLKNSTGIAWASVKINAGAGDLVAVVEGTGLTDEWGFVGNSVVANKAGTFAYSGSYGVRDYGGGVYGNLWAQSVFTFGTPLPSGQSVSFRIYTDNSYYEGPYASSFCVCLTPTAVPEPGSMLVLSSGILGLGGAILRRRR